MRIVVPSDWSPPLPPDWEEAPRLAVFFLPLREPLAVRHGTIFTFERRETVGWLKGAALIQDVGYPPLPRKPERSTSFVSLRIWRPREDFQFDSTLLDRAFKVAHEVLPDGLAPIVLDHLARVLLLF